MAFDHKSGGGDERKSENIVKIVSKPTPMDPI